MNITPADLTQFNCTECYYRTMSKNVVYTSGAQYLFANGGDSGAYWLLDEILFNIIPLRNDPDFILVEVEVENNKATLKGSDGNGKYFTKKPIPYTDLADGVWKLYVEPSECGGEPVDVILLTHEH